MYHLVSYLQLAQSKQKRVNIKRVEYYALSIKCVKDSSLIGETKDDHLLFLKQCY